MLRIDNTHMNFNASSIIEDNIVAQFGATHSGAEEIYFNFTVINLANYEAHREAVEADFATFKDKALESINGLKF